MSESKLIIETSKFGIIDLVVKLMTEVETFADFKGEKKKEYVSNKGVAQYSRQYGGQFHFPKIGKNIVFGMDGYAGQQILIDITNGRIVIIHTIDQHYDWNKIGLSVIKN